MFCERNSVGERAATFRDVKRLEPINYPFIEKGQHSSKTVVVNRGQKKKCSRLCFRGRFSGQPKNFNIINVIIILQQP